MAYISNCLTHWVGARESSDDNRYEILVKSILARQELLYNLCEWNFRSKYGGVNNHHFPMICFADIPFTETYNHCEKYSRFGLSFSKSYLTNCLASPVGYVLNPDVFKAYSFLYHRLNGIRSLFEGKEIPEGQHKGEICRWKDITHNLHEIVFFLEGYDKEGYEFSHSGIPLPEQEAYFENPHALYYEREWRMLSLEERSTRPWDVDHDGKRYFKFDPNHLMYIIMPRSYLKRFSEDAAVYLKGCPSPLPTVIAFESLKYL